MFVNKRARTLLSGTTLLLALTMTVSQGWARPGARHRTDRPGAAYHAVERAIASQARDTALPAGIVDVSQDTSGIAHSQGMAAVSPANSNQITTFFYDARSNYDAQAAYSSDGGATWNLSTMPSSVPSGISSSTGLSDPTATADSQGRFYVAGGGPDPVNTGQTLSVFVMRSDDGGANFTALNPPSAAITLRAGQSGDFLDHQSNWADASGVTSNDYVSVSSIATIANSHGAESQTILFNESTTGGSSWVYTPSSALQVSDTAPNAVTGDAVPNTRVDTNGKVFVGWINIDSSNNCYMDIDKADIPNGGSFTTDVRVAGPLTTSANLFNAYFGDIRAGVYQTMAIDLGTTATKNNVYVAWTDQVSSLGSTFKIWIARSTDGGTTFSAPIRVDTSMDSNGSSSDHQTVPSVAVNPANGQVVVTYYSTHFNTTARGGPNSPITTSQSANNTPLVDLLCAVGTPNSSGGLDFAGPYRVTSTSIDVLAADNANNTQYDPILGDYTGLNFRPVTGGQNSVVVFSTVDTQNRVSEVGVTPFDGAGTLTPLSGGTFEFAATATHPVSGLAATIDWGDGSAVSNGLDSTHNYAAGSYTATATIFDGSSAQRTLTFSVTSTGVFSVAGATAGTSTVATADTLVALGAASGGTTSTTGTTTTGTTGTTTTGTTGTTTTGTTGTTTTGTTGTTTTGGSTTGSSTTGDGSSSGGGGGCFIATAAYGSYFEPHVMTLRHFRDDYLLTNSPGQSFVKFYYHNSPPVANWIAERSWARFLVRVALTPMVFALEHTFLFCLFVLSALGAGRLWWKNRPAPAVDLESGDSAC